LEKILYFKAYVVIDPMLSELSEFQMLTEDEYNEALDKFGESAFIAETGAEALKSMLSNLKLRELSISLRADLKDITSETKRKKIAKRLKIVEQFLASNNKPEHMVLTILPVIPPDLRPLVMLDGGRFATADLNELYRRVINRNNRLKRLIELSAPDIIIRNEKRMLQESVDALFDNSKRGRSVKNASNKRPFKSLSDMLKGKQGRFRQNLLGKRVDYSGRSVIVVGPELKLHQCGIPKRMALELFKPFIYSKLCLYGIASTLKVAKRLLELNKPEVWDMLEEVIHEHPVLLNRAPTLHRLGIQAFEPVLIEGKAIQLHPLVCAPFNADFDGDQMAVHVPLSIEAQLEARVLMMSTNNILSPANGRPVIVPTQDIVLGLYYMSLEYSGLKGEGLIFADDREVEYALHEQKVLLHTKIKCRKFSIDVNNNKVRRIVETTPGRLFIGNILPENPKIGFELVNRVIGKKEITDLVDTIYRACGPKEAVLFSDNLMRLGFKYATRSGISIGKDDMLIPKSKKLHVAKTLDEVRRYENQYMEGLITKREEYNKIVDSWSRCSERITADMMDLISGQGVTPSGQDAVNNIFMMADSGARSSAAQIKQIAGMRGLMTKPSGEIIKTPIISNFKEGLTELEFFTSTHGARKGLADTALKTANSGYLTRKLVDVAQDCSIVEDDCKTQNGILSKMIVEGGEVIVPLSNLIVGRVSAIDIKCAASGGFIVNAGQMIDERIAERIEEAGIDSVRIRSALTCESNIGICARCYGRDLATGYLVSIGEAVGVVAAQSIGEPGTQLTMRTFHIGGAAQRASIASNAISSCSGILKFVHNNTVIDSKGENIVMSRSCEAIVMDSENMERARYKIPYGSKLLMLEGARIDKGDKIAEWDPFTVPIIVEKGGRASFIDLIHGVSFSEIQDESTGIANKVVIDSRKHSKASELRPRIVLVDNETSEILTLSNGLEARYFLPVNAVLNILDNEIVHAGDVIARISKESYKSRDITGGLPRVVELFEARQPKDHSVISEISGYVEFGKDYKSKRRIIVRPENELESPVEYFVQRGRHIVVNEGDFITKGEMLMEGNPSPHDILRVMGVEALAHYMIQEVQQVYRLQGVEIDNKHIEVIIRQMLQKVEIIEPGETTLLVGEQVDKVELEEENEAARKSGYTAAASIPVLQGITKASLQTNSFLSAASFQETTRVLTEAAVAGKKDLLRGLKENVIIGKLVPVGTGAYVNLLQKKSAKINSSMNSEASVVSEDFTEEGYNAIYNEEHKDA
ncbi:MAG: DNA-directed RNA polymerase subunit beta', partial [Proteobacteria bacterium]|nr:DNA-directed RNA polymerase subunit beta' [Pseudomonadota bacterium]